MILHLCVGVTASLRLAHTSLKDEDVNIFLQKAIIDANVNASCHLTLMPAVCLYRQVMEVETEEGLRRAELAQADRDTTYKFNREVRREKSHWKIESNRKNVILRNRPRYQAIVAQVRANIAQHCLCIVCTEVQCHALLFALHVLILECGLIFAYIVCPCINVQTKKARDLRYASTVSYERRAREWDTEQLTQEKLLAADARAQDEENKPKTCVHCWFSFCLMPVCMHVLRNISLPYL